MKATGIVRRIDDLGRIVIPKEIRKTLKIHEGSPMEIYTDENCNIIFKKYSPVGEMTDIAQIYAETISETFGGTCVIIDTEKVLAASGQNKKELKGKAISERMINFLSQQKVKETEENIKICDTCERFSSYISMINSSGDIMGAVIIADINEKIDINHRVLTKIASILLAKQIQ